MGVVGPRQLAGETIFKRIFRGGDGPAHGRQGLVTNASFQGRPMPPHGVVAQVAIDEGLDVGGRMGVFQNLRVDQGERPNWSLATIRSSKSFRRSMPYLRPGKRWPSARLRSKVSE